jgi:hypothetical protein
MKIVGFDYVIKAEIEAIEDSSYVGHHLNCLASNVGRDPFARVWIDSELAREENRAEKFYGN